MPFETNSLEEHWMPFTGNRDFKANPRLIVKSEGMYCWDYKGGQVIDGSSALFCTPAVTAVGKSPRPFMHRCARTTTRRISSWVTPARLNLPSVLPACCLNR